MGRFSAVVVEHFSRPQNFGEHSAADVRAFVANPHCGDQLLLTGTVVDGSVDAVRFMARGCAASLAVGSLLTTVLPGRSLKSLLELTDEEITTLAGGLAPEQRHVAGMAVEAVRRFAANAESGVNDAERFACDV